MSIEVIEIKENKKIKISDDNIIKLINIVDYSITLWGYIYGYLIDDSSIGVPALIWIIHSIFIINKKWDLVNQRLPVYLYLYNRKLKYHIIF